MAPNTWKISSPAADDVSILSSIRHGVEVDNIAIVPDGFSIRKQETERGETLIRAH